MFFLDDVRDAGERVVSNSFYDVASQPSAMERADYYRSAGICEDIRLQVISEDEECHE